MESSQKLFIDKQAAKQFRKYKDGDHIFYLYGIDEHIFGIWPKNENLTLQEFIESFSTLFPCGVKLNGIIMIYNDNTYEDFEEVLNQEKKLLIERFSSTNIVTNQIYLLAMKELLYLDDFDEIALKKSILYMDNKQEEITPTVIDISLRLIERYYVLKCRINLIYDNEGGKKNVFSVESEDDAVLEDNNIFININGEKEKFVLDFSQKDDEINHAVELIQKLNLKENKNLKEIEFMNFDFTLKEWGGSKMIKINDIKVNSKLNNKEENYLEVCGYLRKSISENSNKNIFRDLIALLRHHLKNLALYAIKLQIPTSKFLSYNPLFCPYPITVFSPYSLNSAQLKFLNLDSTTFAQNNLLVYIPNKLINIHSFIDRPIPAHSLRFITKGRYEYFHYMHDNINDKGWGCAYRSLQTLFSWYLINGQISTSLNIKQIPSILDIQKTLVKANDKDAKIIGSSDWIGAFEVSIVLNELIGVDSQIVYVSSGADLNQKGRELAYHFENVGTPIMIGGGVYAYTILGVEYDRVKGDCKFLILDPHYAGDDDIKTIINKGWCEWKTSALFEKNQFYNLCMPQLLK